MLIDRKRVLEGGPWVFDSNLLVLKESDAFADPADTSFDLAEFWVQIHKVPMLCMSRSWGYELGKSVGSVKDVEINASGDCLGRYLRVRILVDISQPLPHVVQRRLRPGAEPFLFPLWYERLPDLCFFCGILGHPFKECILKPVDVRKDSVLKYGDWIRASLPVKPNGPGQKRGRFREPESLIRGVALGGAKAFDKKGKDKILGHDSRPGINAFSKSQNSGENVLGSDSHPIMAPINELIEVGGSDPRLESGSRSRGISLENSCMQKVLAGVVQDGPTSSHMGPTVHNSLGLADLGLHSFEPKFC